jgi:hypothetical protein
MDSGSMLPPVNGWLKGITEDCISYLIDEINAGSVD